MRLQGVALPNIFISKSNPTTRKKINSIGNRIELTTIKSKIFLVVLAQEKPSDAALATLLMQEA